MSALGPLSFEQGDIITFMDGHPSTNMCNESKMSPDSVESSVLSSFSGSSNDPIPDVKSQHHLTLQSPGGGDQLTFIYSSPNTEFVDILKLALEEFEGLKQVVEKSITVGLDDLYTQDYEVLNRVCKVFNKAANANSKLWKGSTRPGNNADLASPKFLQRILAHCYNKAVVNEKALNKHYEPFSSCTYGETSFERMQTIIDELKPTSQDVFVDLGSGVGQLVVHMAGGSRVKKAFGIEIAKLPAKFAALLEEEFRKLMRFYGKKVRQFSLELGNFLDEKYRELITKEATIIFINNYAFTPELESRIKHELLFELQSGTRVVSTKPYAANKFTVNAREVNDFSSIADIQELKRCPNPCSWTSSDVPYFLHTVDHGKIEKYVSNLKPNALRALEGRRSLTPSSSKNSNSRESSVSMRGASKKHGGVYGATTRRKWKDLVSEKQSFDDPMENKDFSEPKAYLSDSDSSEPEKKRKKAKKQAKARTSKAKRSSENRLELIEGSGNVDLSEDAKDGMELMHQMTQAVSSGQSIDNTKTALLADLSNNDELSQIVEMPKETFKRSNFKQTDMMFPLSDAILPSKRRKRPLNSDNVSNEKQSNSKYAHLDVFLSELRRTYELFLDDIYSLPNSVGNVKTEKPTAGPSNAAQKIALPSEPIVQNPGIDGVLQMVDRINQKYADLGQDIGNLRKAIASLHTPAQAETVSKVPNHVQPNGISSNGILPHPTNLTNGNGVHSLIETSNSYANLLTNGNTHNGAAYNSMNPLLNTYLNNMLTGKYFTNAKSLSDLTQATSIALQNSTAQHISPQQQTASYTNQLNGLQLASLSNGLNSTNLMEHRFSSAGQCSEIIASLSNVLSSNNYTEAEKQELLQRALQNPAASNALQTFLASTTLSQLQQRSNPINFTPPSTDPISNAETSSANQLLQKSLIYNSQMQINPENGNGSGNGTGNEHLNGSQTVQQYLNEVNKTESQPKGKNKKTERKPRANSKRSKEVPTTQGNQPQVAYSVNEPQTFQHQASNEASTSHTYMNTFNNQMNHQPIGVETILSQQLSIQSHLPLPKEQASFHSPGF